MKMILLLFIQFVIQMSAGEIILDLSHDLSEDSMRYPNMKPFKKTYTGKRNEEGDFWYANYDLKFGEHISTHMDSPSHFAENGYTVDEIPVRNLIGPAVVIDISRKVDRNNLAVLSAEDVNEWENKNGIIPDNAIVFVKTGWGKRYGNALEYYGTSTNDASKLIFPGIGLDAAQIFTKYQETHGHRIVGVGIDTASLDRGDSVTYDTHVELYTHNIYGLENVANLEKLPTTGAEVTVMPIKTKGGSGGPCRIIARISLTKSSSSSSVTPTMLMLLFPIFMSIQYSIK